ncbi:AI-2E family transporter [Litorihabitans aurantiacus]|uniref:AI-2E family transporter n=1 Tax=Litorihabitans aurantiacus TaxID=1930061 RepID=A0AA37UV94_9MICO|nr:AI-2E family transporter [Litorihabitans aurantiacus]GMA31086.1 AI-2E family transporter [Litorihabitans aurantiacus]
MGQQSHRRTAGVTQRSTAPRRRQGSPVRTSDVTGAGVMGMDPDAVRAGDGTPAWLRRAGGYSWRMLVVVAAVAIVVFAVLQVQVVFIAVFLALVVTSVLEPVVSFLARVMPRPLATALAMLLSAATFLGMLTYVVYSVTVQAPTLARDFNTGVTQILDFLENGPLPFSITNDDITGWIADGQRWLLEHSGDIAGTVFSNAGSVFEVFTILALGVFTTVFFLAVGRSMWVWFLNQLPARSRLKMHEAAGAGWYTFAGYARGTVIIAVIDGVLAYILLTIVGVPLAAPLSVLVMIGAFIPLVGAPAAMIVAAVVALAANGPIEALIVTLGIAGIGQVEGHLLQPLIMGRQVSLHPVVVALGVTAGTFLGGLLGAIVAIPLIAVTWTVYSRLRRKEAPLDGELATVKEIVTKDLVLKGRSRTARRADDPGAVRGENVRWRGTKHDRTRDDDAPATDDDA